MWEKFKKFVSHFNLILLFQPIVFSAHLVNYLIKYMFFLCLKNLKLPHKVICSSVKERVYHPPRIYASFASFSVKSSVECMICCHKTGGRAHDLINSSERRSYSFNFSAIIAQNLAKSLVSQ